jgi:hypothetical protein
MKNDRNGEGGITLPASAAIMLPAYRCCLHALEALEQGQSNEFESPVRESAGCGETERFAESGIWR